MSTKPKSKSTTNMQFVGIAQTIFPSFMALARDSLEQYCPNWNEQSHPASYIFSPTFTFKNADKSDEDIELIETQLEEEKNNGAPQNVLDSMKKPALDRQSDDAEFLVFLAIWTLVQEKIQAPFLAVHGLDLDHLKQHFQTIFPDDSRQYVIQDKFKEMMREYDFVLIGPNIGIVVIEVKSPFFTKGKDFVAKSRSWPEQIVTGVKQLNSFDLEFFKDCSGIQAPSDLNIRRILFTPNLEKNRVEAWLETPDKEKAKEYFASKGITHWLKEDTTNSTGHSKPALYRTIRKMIEEPGFQISQEIYESYGVIISGLSSSVVLENQSITLSIERLSTSAAILCDHVKLDTHDPSHKLQQLDSKSPKKQKTDRQEQKTNLDTVSINIDKVNKLMLLNPEQRAALNGPERQFIAGGPGSGKTIILQEKARQLLKDGKNILLMAPPSYHEKYQKFFDNYGCDKYEIRSHAITDDMILTDTLITSLQLEDLQITLRALSEYVKNILEIRAYLTNFDAILVDDAFDLYDFYNPLETERLLFFILLLFALARSCEFSSKVVWIAGDFFSSDGRFQWLFEQIVEGQQEDYFTCALLQRVMRSSVRVSKETYSQGILSQLPIKPSLGHNIHGFYESIHLQMPSELEIWEQTERAVQKFRAEGFDYAHMAVIIGGTHREEWNNMRTYLESEFRKNGIPVDRANVTSHSLSSLTLDIVYNVSSLEWPIVVYVAMQCDAKSERVFEAPYYRYRACSRATMELFEITADWVVEGEECAPNEARPSLCKRASYVSPLFLVPPYRGVSEEDEVEDTDSEEDGDNDSKEDSKEDGDNDSKEDGDNDSEEDEVGDNDSEEDEVGDNDSEEDEVGDNDSEEDEVGDNDSEEDEVGDNDSEEDEVEADDSEEAA